MFPALSPRCLVLASGSPRRLELLGQLVQEFSVIVSGVPEPVDERLSPVDNVLATARSKAVTVAPMANGCVVLAADTEVVVDGEILGKPVDAADAESMLQRLRGLSHQVLTAVVVLDATTGTQRHEVIISEVRIGDLTDEEISAYVSTGEPFDKAGGYAIQGEAGSMVESVYGCYTNVVGLPLCATRRLLASFDITMRPDAPCMHPDGTSCAN